MEIEFYLICYKMVMFSISIYLYYSAHFKSESDIVEGRIQTELISCFLFTHFCLPSSKSVVNTCTRNFWRILLLRKTQTFTQWSFNLRSTCTTCILFFFRSVDLVSCFTGHPDFRRHGLCYGHASWETLSRCQDNRNLRRN